MTTKNESPAHPLHRFLAWLTDYLLGFLSVLGGVWLVSTTTRLEVILANLALSLALVLIAPLVLLGLNTYLTHRVGGSLGKIVWGLAISTHGHYLSFGLALFRSTVGYLVAGSFCGLGFLWSLFNPQRQGWHDLILDDVVLVKDRWGLIIGTLSLVALVIASSWLLSVSVANFQTHSGLYQQMAKSF